MWRPILGLSILLGLSLAPQVTFAGSGTCQTLNEDWASLDRLDQLYQHNLRTQWISQSDQKLRDGLSFNHSLIRWYRRMTGQEDAALYEEIHRTIDTVDFLMKAGMWKSAAEMLDPIFLETQLSYITVKLARQDIAEKRAQIRSIEQETGIKLQSVLNQVSMGVVFSPGPSVEFRLFQTQLEIGRLENEIHKNLVIFGRNYESYRRLSSHIYHVSKGKGARPDGDKAFFPIHFPSQKKVYDVYVDTAQFLNRVLGWPAHRELFKGKEEEGDREFLARKLQELEREESDKFHRHPDAPTYDALRVFFRSERVALMTGLKKVRRAEFFRGVRVLFYGIALAGSKIAVVAARANNVPLLRKLGPQWIVTLFRIAFAKYSRYAYFPLIHQVLRSQTPAAQLEALRMNLKEADRDLLVAFSMLIEKEPREAWARIRKEIDRQAEKEKLRHPTESARLLELGREMDKAAEQGLGLGSLSFIAEQSPLSSLITFTSFALAYHFAPDIIAEHAGVVTTATVGLGMTPEVFYQVRELAKRMRSSHGPKLSPYQEKLREVVEELLAENKLPSAQDPASHKLWLTEIAQRLEKRGIKEKDLEALMQSIAKDEPILKESVDEAP